MLDGVIDIPLPGRLLGRLSVSDARPDDADVLRRFVIGPENRLIEAAVQSIFDAGRARDMPILLLGPAGVGKSHLALGLAAAFKNSFPSSPVISTTAVDFARQLADAVETKTIEDFDTRYRRAGLLVIDDLDYVVEKPAAQQELLHTLDALWEAGSRAVFTARTAPGQLTGLVPRLRSRLTAGLTIEIAPPGPAARLTILERLAEARHVDLPDPVARLLAEGLAATVPELRGALSRLQMSAELDGGVIDQSRVQAYLAEWAASRAPTLEQIAAGVARHFTLKVSELRCATRARAVVAARGVAMYLARSLTANSLEQIGRYFGGRDHTTVSHACRKTDKLFQTEPAIRQAVLLLREKLGTP